jgi:hypothetical protein
VIEGAVLEHEDHDVLDFRKRVGHRRALASENSCWPRQVSMGSCAYCVLCWGPA